MKKRILVLCFAVAMLCGVHGSAMATTYSEEKVKPISTYRDEDLDIDPVDMSSVPTTWSTRNSVPISYESPYVTSVKDQNPYGTCWAFAFVSASEASLVQEGLASLGTDEVDLSELHLAYFMSHSVTDPLGGTEGDGFYLTDTSTNAFLEVGGNQRYATFRVANWYGLVDENIAPYDSVVKGQAMTLSDDIAYEKDRYHLENAYWISMQDHETVKKLIMEYGACGSSYHDADVYYNVSYAWNLEEKVAIYCPDENNTNHAITIVGWDDDYGADNFGTHKPSANGAWLCKNSWGTDFSEDGYFWISYEDVPLNSSIAFFYDYGTADNYDKNYQYDGGAMSGSYPVDTGANIFTAQADEYIKAVGFYTINSNYDCVVRVYKNCTEGNPASGTLIDEVQLSQPYAGFHTVELEESCVLKEGERFSVVVCQSTGAENTSGVLVDQSYSDGTSWFSNVSAATIGQSFINAGGTYWQDVSKDGHNCRIKAYTDVRIPVTAIDLNKEKITLYTGETDTLSATVMPDDASETEVTWSSSDDTVAMVDEKGVVTAKKAGTVTITCKSNEMDVVESKCTVTVKQWVEGVSLNASSGKLLEEETLSLTTTISPADATDKSLSWTSSNKDVVTVSDTGVVTAVGYGTAMVTCTATDRSIYSASCEISVCEKIDSITLEEVKEIYVGASEQLEYSVTPTLERTKGVTWSTDKEDVVTVDSTGKITAKKAGTAVITCQANDSGAVKAQCVVTVVDPIVVREKGDVIKDSATNAEYKVTASGTTGATVQFAKGSNTSGKVTIPDTITIDGVTYKVTTIAANAFKGNTKVTKIVIKDNVTSIGKNAFYGCAKLTSVTIGKNVTTIGDNAFYNCKKLKTVTLGQNVKTIGNKAFYQCSKLSKIVIPSNVTKIGKQAFYKCKSLKSITIKTAKLTKKKVGSNAFKGIHSKATIKVPKKQLKSYKSILKTRGIGGKVKVKKL